jgi:hypothetical protein
MDGMGRGRRLLALSMVVGLACLGAAGAEMCSGDCVIRAERVTPAGLVPFNNSEPLVTAVGCLETLDITFGRINYFGTSAQPPKSVTMLTSDRSTTVTASTVLDDSDEGLKNRICCAEHPMDRDRLLEDAGPQFQNQKCYTDQALALAPLDFFDCMIQTTDEKTADTMRIRIQFIIPERADVTVDGEEELMGMYGTNSFLLQADYEAVVSGALTAIQALEYRVNVQVQRCSACLQSKEGLVALAKRFGTHWTQIYSANEDIVGSPDELDEARLVRLGSLYSVREGDTLMSIALKFGVTVNQLFVWNGYLRNALDTMPESANHMSRALAIGQVACLPLSAHPSSHASAAHVNPAWCPCAEASTLAAAHMCALHMRSQMRLGRKLGGCSCEERQL